MDSYSENLLDKYITELEKKELEIPAQLEARIMERIEKVELNNRYALGTLPRKILAAACVFLLFFAITVKWVPGFAAYASGIPIVKYAVEWIQGDSGTELAKKEGYPELGPVTAERNGCTLVIDHIMFDEDRLVMSLHAYGKKVEEALAAKETGKPVRAGEEPRYSAPQPTIRLKFPDFRDGSYSAEYGGENYNDRTLEIRAEKVFAEGEVRGFLAGRPEFLTLTAEVILTSRDPDQKPEVLQTFENIKIPLDTDKIKLSKTFAIKQRVTVDKARLVVESLTLSPTRMRVDVSVDLPEGYFFTGFENPYIKDSKGNIYKPEGLVSRHSSETTRSLLFVPSVYFDDSHDKIYFGFDGIRIGADEGKSFTISMQDSYPRTINYMGEEIVIEKAAYTSGRSAYPLQIQMRLPEALTVQDIKVIGAKSNSHGKAKGLNEDGKPVSVDGMPVSDLYGLDVEYRDKYQAELGFPGYLINSSQAILMELGAHR